MWRRSSSSAPPSTAIAFSIWSPIASAGSARIRAESLSGSCRHTRRGAGSDRVGRSRVADRSRSRRAVQRHRPRDSVTPERRVRARSSVSGPICRRSSCMSSAYRERAKPSSVGASTSRATVGRSRTSLLPQRVWAHPRRWSPPSGRTSALAAGGAYFEQEGVDTSGVIEFEGPMDVGPALLPPSKIPALVSVTDLGRRLTDAVVLSAIRGDRARLRGHLVHSRALRTVQSPPLVWGDASER